MNEEQMKNALANAMEIAKVVDKFYEKIGNSVVKAVASLQPIFEKVNKMLASEFMSGLANALKKYADDIEKAKNNPNSYFSYMKYQKDLDTVHWAWPYEITAEELKSLLENTNSEKDFDRVMISFFAKEKVEKMVQEISCALPNHHRMMLKQVKNAFDRKDYAIANNALMSIIDNMLTSFLKNKGQNKRVGILVPIIEYYESFPLNEVEFVFELCMLSNNIDFIFQNYSFDKRIEINTNKKVRRHTSLHGFKYSNKKVDALLLLNTLISICKFQSILKEFNGSLIIDKQSKKFVFSEEKQRKLDEIKCSDAILSVIELGGQVEHEEILNTLKMVIPACIVNQSRYLSQLLQKMKKKKLIICQNVNGKKCWMLYAEAHV